MHDELLASEAQRLLAALTHHGLSLATAESCTGGWIAKLLTDIPGSSACLERGFVTYSNLAKQQMLGVPPQIIQDQGAVSEAVVRAMALGALTHSQADLALAVSGIAGPSGGSTDKPVGSVWLAWARRNGPCRALLQHFSGDRDQVRRQAVLAALRGVSDLL
jgi:nicotinamide-nucleotide amidase